MELSAKQPSSLCEIEVTALMCVRVRTHFDMHALEHVCALHETSTRADSVLYVYVSAHSHIQACTIG